MTGVAEGWALQQIAIYEEGSYPEWNDVIVGIDGDAITMPGLQTIINREFTRGDQPKYMLKQL